MIIIVAGKKFEMLPQVMKRFRENIDKNMSGLLKLIGEQVVGRSRDKYLSGPRPKKLGHISGNLAQSVLFRVEESRVTVGSNLPYAPVHEFGATIRAKRAPFLRFKTLDGKWHSVKSVTIPARPFLRPAIADSIGVMKRLTVAMFNRAYAGASGV